MAGPHPGYATGRCSGAGRLPAWGVDHGRYVMWSAAAWRRERMWSESPLGSKRPPNNLGPKTIPQVRHHDRHSHANGNPEALSIPIIRPPLPRPQARPHPSADPARCSYPAFRGVSPTLQSHPRTRGTHTNTVRLKRADQTKCG